MQGVQPTPKRIPKSGAPTKPPVVLIVGRNVGANGNLPRNTKPRNIVITPKTLDIKSSFATNWLPSPPKIAPNEMNTTLNPRTNKIEPRNTLPRFAEKPAAKDK